MKKPSSSLGTTILKNVSRSFYLSLRLLPASMREAAGLGYLLARSSDTLADTAEVAVDVRLAQLDALALSIAANASFRTDPILLQACTPAEKILLQSIDDQLLWLTQLDPSSQHLIREVLAVIISGQRLDLVRFGHASDQQHVALHDDATLLDYCHRVAGCVGLFWTRLGHLAEGSDFSEQSVSTMEEWGRQLGCGLQLVNILRDRPEDIANGRFYLPGTNLLHDDEQLHAHDRWIAHARKCIEAGLRYADHVKGRRARCATVLPALLAIETLDLLEKATWQEMKQRVKIGKATVFRCLAEAWLYPYRPEH
jgi:farnesyl-diphosphate farnesyltransferase